MKIERYSCLDTEITVLGNWLRFYVIFADILEGLLSWNFLLQLATPLLTPRQSLVVCIPTNIVNDPWVELRNSVTMFFWSSIRKSLLLQFSDFLFIFKGWNVRDRGFWGNTKNVHLFTIFVPSFYHVYFSHFESIKTVSLHFLLTRETLNFFRMWAKNFTAERQKLKNSAQNTKCLFYYLRII